MRVGHDGTMTSAPPPGAPPSADLAAARHALHAQWDRLRPWIGEMVDAGTGTVASVLPGWTIAELAKLMGASRSGFAQRFVDVVGETPARYIASMRIHQAHQWLKEGQRVASVANRLGYDSEASFSRAFRKMMGAPPSHYRSKPAMGDAVLR